MEDGIRVVQGARVLVCFLGIGKYEAVSYRLESSSPVHETYVQAAIVQQVGPFDRVVLAMTAQARKQHGAPLKMRLEELRGTASYEEIELPEVKSSADMWTIFSKLGEHLHPGERVSFDITHGFRMLPQIALLALGFYGHTRQLTIEGIYYGAYEARERDEASGQEVAPLFDLRPMFVLPSWAEAVAEWQRTGRPEGIVELVKPETQRIRSEIAHLHRGDKKALSAAIPQELVNLPSALESLAAAMQLVRHDQFGPAAQKVLQRAEGAVRQIQDHDELRPLGVVLGEMADTTRPLARVTAQEAWEDPGYLSHQLQGVRWLAARGYLVEPFSLLRECLASCAVRLAWQAGRRSLPSREESLPLGSSGFREAALGLAAEAGRRSDRQLSTAEQEVVAALQDLRPLSFWAPFEVLAGQVRTLRNRLDHCWTGKDHEKVTFSEGLRVQVRRELLDCLERAAQLVAQVDPPGTSPAREEPAPARPALFLNLSNHPLATWDEAQQSAAVALGHGPVADLEGGMPLVDPALDESQVAALAEQIAHRAAAQGAHGAHVATDYGLTWSLVLALQARGIPAYQATTRRDSEMVVVEGVPQKRSHFTFVRWRRYS
jgi:CRISPR-associated DxTHG motif protein